MVRRRGADRTRERVGFDVVAGHVEEAKEALLRAVPGARRPPAPLADSLASFEDGLRQARGSLASWHASDLERHRDACRDALDEASRRAERLRLEAPAMDFEQLVLTLGDLIAPLDAFAEAERALRAR